MISFQEYFEKRVEELIGNSGNQTFFVFRGFEIEQIKYLVSHPNSILNDTALVQNGYLDLSTVENSKKSEIGEPKKDLERVEDYKDVIFWSFSRKDYQKTNWWSKTASANIGSKLTIRTANTVRKIVKM